MSRPVVRTAAAAQLLGVSPNTLRSWERRYGFPKPQRTNGGHRKYDLRLIGELRQALDATEGEATAAMRIVQSGMVRQFTQHQLVNRRWRVGRDSDRTIHAMLGSQPSDADPLIGTMDTAELAKAAVDAHNVFLEHESKTLGEI